MPASSFIGIAAIRSIRIIYDARCMTPKTPRPAHSEVPVLDDIVEHSPQQPPNHDLFAGGNAIDPAALQMALQEQLGAWLNAMLPDILQSLERDARATMEQRLNNDLPELLSRTLHKLQTKPTR